MNEALESIYTYINREENQQALIADSESWNIITSSLYVIVDTDTAIDYYLNMDYPESTGGKYLVTYGIL